MNSYRKQLNSLSLILVLGLFLTLVAIGCDQGDDDDDEKDLKISFVADGQAGEGEIALSLNSAKGDLLTVDVLVGDGFDPVYGLVFRLTYDNEVMAFKQLTPGEALGGGGVELLSMAKENQAGDLLFGISRTDTFEAQDLADQDVIASISFKATGKGKTSLAFAETKKDLVDDRLDTIEVNNWLGGEVTVR